MNRTNHVIGEMLHKYMERALTAEEKTVFWQTCFTCQTIIFATAVLLWAIWR